MKEKKELEKYNPSQNAKLIIGSIGIVIAIFGSSMFTKEINNPFLGMIALPLGAIIIGYILGKEI